MGETQTSIEFLVNGQKRTLAHPDTSQTLLEYLRRDENYTGAKVSCGQGGCGACTVLVTSRDPVTGEVRNASCNSCIKPLCAVDGCAVTTTEGIGNVQTGLHPVQERIAGNNGSQCGYCTPGMVMQMYSCLQEKDGAPTAAEIERRLDGNICRCTGYRPILGACKSFASDKSLCGVPCDIEDVGKKYKAYDHAKDPQPTLDAPRAGSLAVQGSDNRQYLRPTTLQEVFQLRTQHANDNTRIICGNTMTGVYGPNPNVRVTIDVSRVAELQGISDSADGIVFGAAVTLGRVIETLKARKTHQVIIDHLLRVAGHNVRNQGTWAGNLMMARKYGFPSDVATVLYGAGVRVTVATSATTTATHTVGELLASTGDVVVLSMTLPPLAANEQFATYRAAMRPVNAHALINAAMRAKVGADGVISDANIIYGVVARHAVRAKRAEAAINGQVASTTTYTAALAALAEDLKLDEHHEHQYITVTQPEGKDEYRKNLTANFLYKFLMQLRGASGAAVAGNDLAASVPYVRPLSHGRQEYRTHPDREASVKLGSDLQASGEAKYVDDMAPARGDLFGAWVMTTKAATSIAAVDAAAALRMPGVVDFITAKDVPGANDCGMNGGEEEVFATEKSPFVGKPVGIIVATSQAEARAAAKAVSITYGNAYEEAIYSIKQAIEKRAYFDDTAQHVENGDLNAGFASADTVVEGEMTLGGQAHFYMERQTALAVPVEGDLMHLYIGCQAPDYTRAKIASVLGVPGSQVTVQIRRAGGGFGGKLTAHTYVAAAAAVAARKTRRPVRLVTPIQEDMAMIGGRHEILAKYKVGFKRDGSITAVDIDSYGNCGYSHDLSGGTMSEYNSQLDSCYFSPAFRYHAIGCRTNLSSRTAVRTFGHIQAIAITETVIEHVARSTGLTPEAVREKNMYTKRNCINATGMFMDGYNAPELWAQLKEKAGFDARVAEVNAFNAANRWRKRGISMVPMYYAHAQNDSLGKALVNVNASDGSVVVYHGGCEIGQGIHTKVAQIVAQTFGIPLSKVRVGDTNTDVTPNTAFTGGSTGSEDNCEAARRACLQIIDRLAPLKAELGAGGKKVEWEQLVSTALSRNFNLSAADNMIPIGRANDRYNYPWQKHPADYCTFGVAAAEVEIDVLTGEVDVRRSDVLFDAGASLNPLVDIGQAEGGFVMGLGYFLREEVLVSSEGVVMSPDTWEYKPPSVLDIPTDFRVELLKDSHFDKGVLGSKAIGEPPMVLSYCVGGAVRSAISAARTQFGAEAWVHLEHPFTVDRVQRACAVPKAALTL